MVYEGVDIVKCTPLIRRVLVRMTGFISSWLHSLIITRKHRQYSAVSHLHTLQFTAAHVLGFSLSTSRLPATDLDAQTEVLYSKYYT
jgi:hypothetical protein